MNTLSVNNLEIILTRLIANLREQGIQELFFDKDMYWEVPIDQLDLLTEEPKLIVGSLEDDVSFLNRTIEEEIITNYLELERLSAVFKAMAKQLTV